MSATRKVEAVAQFLLQQLHKGEFVVPIDGHEEIELTSAVCTSAMWIWEIAHWVALELLLRRLVAFDIR